MRRLTLLSLGLAAVLAACSGAPPRSVLPRLREEPSTARPPWLRDLPPVLERYPAPEGWGGDHLAAVPGRAGTG
jgi:hypothetical protein